LSLRSLLPAQITDSGLPTTGRWGPAFRRSTSSPRWYPLWIIGLTQRQRPHARGSRSIRSDDPGSCALPWSPGGDEEVLRAVVRNNPTTFMQAIGKNAARALW